MLVVSTLAARALPLWSLVLWTELTACPADLVQHTALSSSQPQDAASLTHLVIILRM